MGAGAGGGRPRGRVGCGAREEGSGWLKEPGGQPRGCPGFLLKGQVGGDPTAELGFLGRRGDLLPPLSQGILVPTPHQVQNPVFSRLSPSAGGSPPHWACILSLCDLASPPPGPSPLAGLAEGGGGSPGPLGPRWHEQPSHESRGRPVPCSCPVHAVYPGPTEAPTNPARGRSGMTHSSRSGTTRVHRQTDGHTRPPAQGRATRPRRAVLTGTATWMNLAHTRPPGPRGLPAPPPRPGAAGPPGPGLTALAVQTADAAHTRFHVLLNPYKTEYKIPALTVGVKKNF